MHMTWLDIHPSVQARNLLVLSLVDSLISSRATMSKVENTELKATIMYILAGVVMPPTVMICKHVFLQSLRRSTHGSAHTVQKRTCNRLKPS